MNNSQNGTQSSSANGIANAGNNPAVNAFTQEAKQRLWVREQEVNALKIQNRHLLAKLEEAEKKARPDPITSEQITQEVHKNLQPLITQVERSLAGSFEMISGTLKGIYQQSHRAQEVIEEMTAHVKTVETRMQEQRKADQLYFQEKIFATISTFCDRIERQVEQRLKALSVIEVMTSKQNELLGDIEGLKAVITEVQIQNRNAEEMARDGLRQVQAHRGDLKNLRTEIHAELSSMAQTTQEIPENLMHQMDHSLNAQTRAIESFIRDAKNASVDAIREEVSSIEVAQQQANSNSSIQAAPGVQPFFAEVNTSAPKENAKQESPAQENRAIIAPYSEMNEMHDIRSAIEAGEIEASNEDLGLVLELLKSQKNDLRSVAKKSGNFLKRALSKSEPKNETQTENKDTPEVSDVTELRLE